MTGMASRKGMETASRAETRIASLGLAVTGLAVLAGGAHAEPGGLLAGRSGNPGELPERSAELGYRTGDDSTLIGLRVNYRLNERAVLYGDFGKADFEGESVPANDDGVTPAEASGNTFGGGILYHMPDVLEGFDVSLQASYHTADLDGSGAIVVERDGNGFTFVRLENIEFTSLYAGAVISSPEPLSANGLSWYGALGYGQIDSKAKIRSRVETLDDDVSGAVFELGLVLPLASGQGYAGYESFDGDGEFGVGFRYFFK